MNCPNNFIIKVNSRNQNKVNNLIVHLKIFAKEKNDYGLDALITNSSGEIHISKALIEAQISSYKKLFIMDFISDLESCNQQIEIIINSIIKLKEISMNLKKYYPENSEKLEKLILISNNSRFQDYTKVCNVIPIENSVIEINID